ncbi:Catabolite control protein A [Rhodobacteraceae bacterium THAF1]|uniref:LacI family DNA-binding transcriptional regulator n=1 Tax=Palleronia sp. THAF1 TaxID=2587842 RepID=UPI000F414B85|nr:LacI family DNA-binding transcriptional regulator [Palleronia sp. THAF1]QFU07759.1 Catabolite control protein A [Palleronia sp. THAF1]VDC25574.1 Catabolite control protein A [Rhodobacteraceae bacterium THAF1]
MTRSTIHDVARVANVSLSTVDRVLNGRNSVRQSTREKVEEAVRSLGYVRNTAAANLSRQRRTRFVFLLPGGANSFMRNLEDAVVSYAKPLIAEGVDVVVRTVPAFDGAALSRELNALDTDALDGVAFVAVDAPEVRDAVQMLRRKDLPVVTLVSDLPPDLRAHFIGIDNIWAGRTAGRLLGRFCGATPGKIAVVAGALMMQDHAARYAGFRQVLTEDFPHLEPLPPIEARDDAQLAEGRLTDLLASTDGIVGIYSLGAGNRGVVAALKTIRSVPPVVVHELTEHSRDWLLKGEIDAVIRQDPAREARSAVRTLLALSLGKHLNKDENRVGIEIFLRDNLP